MNDPVDSGPLISTQGQSDVETIAAEDFFCTDVEGKVGLSQKILRVKELGIFWKKNTDQSKTEYYMEHQLPLLLGGTCTQGIPNLPSPGSWNWQTNELINRSLELKL